MPPFVFEGKCENCTNISLYINILSMHLLLLPHPEVKNVLHSDMTQCRAHTFASLCDLCQSEWQMWLAEGAQKNVSLLLNRRSGGFNHAALPHWRGSGTELIQLMTFDRVVSLGHCYSIRPQTLRCHHPTIPSAPVPSCIQEDLFLEPFSCPAQSCDFFFFFLCFSVFPCVFRVLSRIKAYLTLSFHSRLWSAKAISAPCIWCDGAKQTHGYSTRT